MPDNTDVALPFQFRVIHGFTKFPVVADIHSATGPKDGTGLLKIQPCGARVTHNGAVSKSRVPSG